MKGEEKIYVEVRRMRHLNDFMVEIRKNMFVSKNDPDFLKKYAKYDPTNADILFQYAKELETKGQTIKAYEYFQKASEHGHYEAGKILEKTIKKTTYLAGTTAAIDQQKKKKDLLTPLLITLLLLCLLALGAMLFYFFSQFFYAERVNETTIYERNTTSAALLNEPTKAEELAFISVQSGIEYYQDKYGVYPSTLQSLVGEVPENALSVIPPSTSYEKTRSGFTLGMEGIKGHAKTADGLLSLVFYEKTNELGVLKGEELLLLYPVASGRNESPPNESMVTKRVVNPNGGDGVYGTRGFQLTDNFAIHGTDDPSSIGKNVSDGCLRMKNEEMERLYPYIPLGTPFYVETKQMPLQPSLKFLPPFPGLPANLEKESTPTMTYTWKK